jgi:penicillin-binding protein 1A
VAASEAVDGETHGDGEPALAPTPTPDDVVPPDAGSASNALSGVSTPPDNHRN